MNQTLLFLLAGLFVTPVGVMALTLPTAVSANSKIEAENYDIQSGGIQRESCSEGGQDIGHIWNGSYVVYRNIDFGVDANSFGARVAGILFSGSIELRLDDPNGTVVGTCFVPNTGQWQTWMTTYCSVYGASGVHDLYLKFKGEPESDIFKVNWCQFNIEPAGETAWPSGQSRPRTSAVEAPLEAVAIDTTDTHQTIEGLGGAIAFYNGWITAHPYKQEIFDKAFAGLNLSMLRVANWWRGTDGQDTAIYEIVAAAEQSLGHPVPIMISSWSPPATLKSNGEVGNGGTLIKKNGKYDYEGFADYWLDSVKDYIAHGVTPTWISIQNEPDWTASYDSCRFNPSEASWNGQNYASYARALDAVYQKLQSSLATPPKLLGPECVGLYGNAGSLRNYLTQMNSNSFYGIAHHLYGGSTNGTPDGYNPVFKTVLHTTASLFPGKPRFMTEYGDFNDMIDVADLIHNSLVVEQVSGYNHWSLIWPGQIGLIEIENPWKPENWTHPKGYWLNPSYWAMKHYSYFIEPGYNRVTTGSSNPNLLTSAYLSPDHNRLVGVFINRSTTTPVVVAIDVNSFAYDDSHIYQSTGANHFESLGSVHQSRFAVPVSSITTVVLDKAVDVGSAGNPIPADGATGISSGVRLTWTPGTHATTHAVYVGTDFNAVATATPTSLEYQGTVRTSRFSSPILSPETTYYWRVDEIAYSSVSLGPVWSFSTTPAVMQAHLPFDAGSGSTATDVTGNGWTGTLVGGVQWTTGKYGNAVDLNGSYGYVSLPRGVVDGLTDVTFSVWVNLDTISIWSRVFDFGTGTRVNLFLTPRSNTGVARFAITINGVGSEQQINGTEALPTGDWTHVAVTLGNGTGILYVNGTEVGRNSNMTLTPNSLGLTTQNYIGKSQYADPYLNGRVDDFRIYTEVLSRAAISELTMP